MNKFLTAPTLAAALALAATACGGGASTGSSSSEVFSPPSSASLRTTPPTSASSNNGEVGKSVSQIGQDVKTAMSGLRNFHLAGQITSNGTVIQLDMVLTSSGPGGGSMTINGTTFQIVVNGEDLYFMGDANFWTSVAGTTTSVASRVANKWVTGVTSGTDLQSFVPLTKVASFVGGIGNSGNSGGSESVGSPTTFHGQSALPIRSAEGTAYVAASGPSYLLGLQGSGSSLTFDEFNSAHAPSVPSGALDFNSVSGGS